MMGKIRLGLTAFVAIYCCRIQSTSASSPSESTSYVSVRALDKFGQSEQIENAKKAASLQGTLVVASRDTEKNQTIVLSLIDTRSKRPGLLASDKPSMLHLVNDHPPFGAGKPIRTAMVCTGLKGDANWLLEHVRGYSHRVWNRYNTFLDASGAAYSVSQYMQRFWGFDEDEEWTPGLLMQELKQKKQDSWSRPLGLVVMILSSSLPYIFVVEPSGIIQKYTAFAMGKSSNDIMEKLAEVVNKSDKSSPTEDLEERLIRMIHSVVPSTKKETSILVEILSETGVNRRVINPQQATA